MPTLRSYPQPVRFTLVHFDDAVPFAVIAPTVCPARHGDDLVTFFAYNFILRLVERSNQYHQPEHHRVTEPKAGKLTFI